MGPILTTASIGPAAPLQPGKLGSKTLSNSLWRLTNSLCTFAGKIFEGSTSISEECGVLVEMCMMKGGASTASGNEGETSGV